LLNPRTEDRRTGSDSPKTVGEAVYRHLVGAGSGGAPMNKIDIVNELSEKINLNQKVAKVVVDTIVDSIKKAIINGERVEIRGFGSFSLRSYKPYRGRNPKNGEVVNVPEKKLPYFKVGKELRETIWKED
jgi:integration host factor subunit beta